MTVVFFVHLQQLKEQKNAGNRTNEVSDTNLVKLWHNTEKVLRHLRQRSTRLHLEDRSVGEDFCVSRK